MKISRRTCLIPGPSSELWRLYIAATGSDKKLCTILSPRFSLAAIAVGDPVAGWARAAAHDRRCGTSAAQR
jgi:hypothetical protein